MPENVDSYRRNLLLGLAACTALRALPASAATSRGPLQPERFGARGDGKTDDAEALTRCFAEAQAICSKGGNAEVVLSGIYATSRGILVNHSAGNLSIRGASEGAGFLVLTPLTDAKSSKELACLFIRGGKTVGAANSILANARFGAQALRLGPGHGLSAGDVVQIANFTGFMRDRREVLVHVVGVSGDTITLAQPLPFDIDIRQTAEVRKLAVARGVLIDQLTFDAGGISDFSGLYLEYLEAPIVSRISTRGFRGRRGEAQNYSFIIGGSFNQLVDAGSGLSGATDSVKFWDISEAEISGVVARNSNGFGIGLTFASRNQINRIRSSGAAGRGIKLFGACANAFTDVVVENSGKTGLSLSSGSSYNTFEGTVATGNKESGHWLNGTGNNHNRFHNVRSTNNGVDLMVAATAPLIDLDNSFSGVQGGFGRTFIAPSTGTLID